MEAAVMEHLTTTANDMAQFSFGTQFWWNGHAGLE